MDASDLESTWKIVNWIQPVFFSGSVVCLISDGDTDYDDIG